MVHFKQSLAVIIHQLNPWGGQEKSTLNIVSELTKILPKIELFTYQTKWINHDQSELFNSKVCTHRIRPFLRRPAPVMILYFWIGSLLSINRRKKKGSLFILATGTCSVVSDLVQVQYLHSTWTNEQSKLIDRGLYYPHHSRGKPAFLRAALIAYSQLLNQFNAWTERLLYTKNKTYIVLSKQMKCEMIRTLEFSPNIHVIPHGVDCNEFRPNADTRSLVRKSLNIETTEIMLLLVGELERKGLAAAIQGLSKSQNQSHSKLGLVLVAVGAGPHAQFTRLAGDYGVRLVILTPTRKISTLYQAADIFLLPTFYEPFGLVVLEAMASALPVIVPKSCGAAELITHKRDGFLIDDPTSENDIAQGIDFLLSPDERIRMGDQARKTALLHPWSKVALRYAQIIESSTQRLP